jgi:hypothetical protein
MNRIKTRRLGDATEVSAVIHHDVEPSAEGKDSAVAAATAASSVCTFASTVEDRGTPADALLHTCLLRAAFSAKMSMADFVRLSHGPQRRAIVDDVTILVLPLQSTREGDN